MFLLIIIYGYVLVATLVIYFILRDRKIAGLFCSNHPRIATISVVLLILGIAVSFYSTLIEPYTLIIKTSTISSEKINIPIRIAFVSDMQLGKYKKDGWAKKIAEKILSLNPDIVIFGGDQIDNEGTFEDESVYLEPLNQIFTKYPSYFVLGNHEYGIGGSVRLKPDKYTADFSRETINRMTSLGANLLRNSLDCIEIKSQKICLFGTDDIWKRTIDFSDIKNLDPNLPLIFISHNPDGILFYPNDLTKPDLALSGHTHGGQIWLPLLGPIGDAKVNLGNKYYRGLKYYNDIPIYISVGVGESGAPLRFLARPEITVIDLK